nr:MAK10-like protein [Tanacetum cinerariifolium]
MDDVERNNDGLMPYAMLLTRLFKHILKTNPRSLVYFNRFTLHQRVMNSLDIPKKIIKNKGIKAAFPLPPYSPSTNEDDEPSFLTFYEELLNDTDLSKAQKEKSGMFKSLNRYIIKLTKILTLMDVKLCMWDILVYAMCVLSCSPVLEPRKWFLMLMAEGLDRSMDSFQGLTIKVHHHGIDRWIQIQIFYDHVSFNLKCEIDRAADDKLRDENTDESWEIIENLALYDHEGWNDTKEFVNPVKAISTPQSTSKTPDRRLLELEDHINF